MDKQLTLLQQLFLENAALLEMAIVMTDTLGKFITRPVGDPDLLQPMIDTDHVDSLSADFVSILLREVPTAHNREYEITNKTKAILIPIHNNIRLVYYIGFIYSSKLVVDSKLEYFKTIASVAEALLSLESEKGWIRRQVAAVHELSIIIDQPTTSKKLRDMMELLFHAHKGIDFLGYAEKEHGVGFRVTELIHNKEATLLDTHFSLGEGFLGQVATTRQLGYWEHIAKDPRIGFFIQNHVHSQTLMVYQLGYSAN